MEGNAKTYEIHSSRSERNHARVHEGLLRQSQRKEGSNIGYTRALELRQLSICEFVGQRAAGRANKNKTKKKRGKSRIKGACEPPLGTLVDIERGGTGLVRWDR